MCEDTEWDEKNKQKKLHPEQNAASQDDDLIGQGGPFGRPTIFRKNANKTRGGAA